jgi:hypothetical protein
LPPRRPDAFSQRKDRSTLIPIGRFAKLGVTAVPDPHWFLKDDYYTYLQVPYLGLERADDE